MSVKKGDRRDSKVEFDNIYFRIHDDAIKLIQNYFGAKKQTREDFSNYIRSASLSVYKDVFDIGTYIRMANSIYPRTKLELDTRRLYQDKAIGLCFDLLTKYQLTMRTLGVKDDKYTIETGNIVHEINCLKSWRQSDNSRFKNLG